MDREGEKPAAIESRWITRLGATTAAALRHRRWTRDLHAAPGRGQPQPPPATFGSQHDREIAAGGVQGSTGLMAEPGDVNEIIPAAMGAEVADQLAEVTEYFPAVPRADADPHQGHLAVHGLGGPAGVPSGGEQGDRGPARGQLGGQTRHGLFRPAHQRPETLRQHRHAEWIHVRVQLRSSTSGGSSIAT